MKTLLPAFFIMYSRKAYLFDVIVALFPVSAQYALPMKLSLSTLISLINVCFALSFACAASESTLAHNTFVV